MPAMTPVFASGPPSSFARIRLRCVPMTFSMTPRMCALNSSTCVPLNTVLPMPTVPGRMSEIGIWGSAARSAGRTGREQQDVARAEASREVIEQRREELARELEGEIQKLHSGFDPATIEVEEVEIAPRKSDIDVSEVALVWTV